MEFVFPHINSFISNDYDYEQQQQMHLKKMFIYQLNENNYSEEKEEKEDKKRQEMIYSFKKTTLFENGPLTNNNDTNNTTLLQLFWNKMSLENTKKENVYQVTPSLYHKIQLLKKLSLPLELYELVEVPDQKHYTQQIKKDDFEEPQLHKNNFYYPLYLRVLKQKKCKTDELLNINEIRIESKYFVDNHPFQFMAESNFLDREYQYCYIQYLLCTTDITMNRILPPNIDLFTFRPNLFSVNVKKTRESSQQSKQRSSTNKSSFSSLVSSKLNSNDSYETLFSKDQFNKTVLKNSHNHSDTKQDYSNSKKYYNFSKTFKKTLPNETIIVTKDNNTFYQMELRGILFDLNLFFDHLLLPFIISIHSHNDFRPFIYSDFLLFYNSVYTSFFEENNSKKDDPLEKDDEQSEKSKSTGGGKTQKSNSQKSHHRTTKGVKNYFDQIYVKLNTGIFISLQTLFDDPSILTPPNPSKNLIIPLKSKTFKTLDEKYYSNILNNEKKFIINILKNFENQYFQWEIMNNNSNRLAFELVEDMTIDQPSLNNNNNNPPFINYLNRQHFFHEKGIVRKLNYKTKTGFFQTNGLEVNYKKYHYLFPNILPLESFSKTFYCDYSTELNLNRKEQKELQNIFVSDCDLINSSFDCHGSIEQRNSLKEKEKENDLLLPKIIDCNWISKNIILQTQDCFQRKCNYINHDFLKILFKDKKLNQILEIETLNDFYHFVYELFIKSLYYMNDGFYITSKNYNFNVLTQNNKDKQYNWISIDNVIQVVASNPLFIHLLFNYFASEFNGLTSNSCSSYYIVQFIICHFIFGQKGNFKYSDQCDGSNKLIEKKRSRLIEVIEILKSKLYNNTNTRSESNDCDRKTVTNEFYLNHPIDFRFQFKQENESDELECEMKIDNDYDGDDDESPQIYWNQYFCKTNGLEFNSTFLTKHVKQLFVRISLDEYENGGQNQSIEFIQKKLQIQYSSYLKMNLYSLVNRFFKNDNDNDNVNNSSNLSCLPYFITNEQYNFISSVFKKVFYVTNPKSTFVKAYLFPSSKYAAPKMQNLSLFENYKKLILYQPNSTSILIEKGSYFTLTLLPKYHCKIPPTLEWLFKMKIIGKFVPKVLSKTDSNSNTIIITYCFLQHFLCPDVNFATMLITGGEPSFTYEWFYESTGELIR